MPITAIPFKSPPPFELPSHIADMLRTLSLPAAFEQVEQMLMDSGCADVILSVLLDGAGHMRPGPFLAQDPRVTDTLEDVRKEMERVALLRDSDAGKADFMGQAIAAGQPLLLMGDVALHAPDPFPTALRFYLLHGGQSNPVGFLYVFPVQDEAGQVHGAMAFHRWLASGPLNHDQPAIVHAMILELAHRASSLAGKAQDSD